MPQDLIREVVLSATSKEKRVLGCYEVSIAIVWIGMAELNVHEEAQPVIEQDRPEGINILGFGSFP